MHKAANGIFLTTVACIAVVHCVFSQKNQSRTEEMKNRARNYVYNFHYDSAQAVVLNFLDLPDLNSTEKFWGNFMSADIMKSSGKLEESIKALEDCLSLTETTDKPELYTSLVYGNIAESYFTLQKFDEAKKYAGQSLTTSETSLRSNGHAVNYLIMGFAEYTEKNYAESIKKYELAASEYLKDGDSCELPLCYTKMAKVYHAMGNHSAAKEQLKKSAFISDTCHIEQYQLLTVRTLFDIQYENQDYKNALESLLSINNLVESINKKEQKSQMNELIVKYETQIVANENKALKTINEKNEEIVQSQKKALILTVSGLILMAFVIILLFTVSHQLKQAKQKLARLNADLELKVAERTEHLTLASEKINRTTQQLSFQNKQLTDFCNIISHNLRSPLVNISLLVNYLEKSKNEEEKNELLKRIKPVIGNLNETFNELIESLQVRQDTEVASENIRFEDCLNRAINGLSMEIEAISPKIEFDFSDASEISYPPKYLNSIFHNLVSNALKYRSSERNPEIKIYTIKSSEKVVLCVADNGLGIDLVKHGNNLFKIRKTFHDHPDAKGFGLFITKTQVEAMGGKIWAESEPGKGAVFFVEFVNT